MIIYNVRATQEDEHGVLTPVGLAQLARIHQAVNDLRTESSGLTWNDVCLQVKNEIGQVFF